MPDSTTAAQAVQVNYIALGTILGIALKGIWDLLLQRFKSADEKTERLRDEKKEAYSSYLAAADAYTLKSKTLGEDDEFPFELGANLLKAASLLLIIAPTDVSEAAHDFFGKFNKNMSNEELAELKMTVVRLMQEDLS